MGAATGSCALHSAVSRSVTSPLLAYTVHVDARLDTGALKASINLLGTLQRRQRSALVLILGGVTYDDQIRPRRGSRLHQAGYHPQHTADGPYIGV